MGKPSYDAAYKHKVDGFGEIDAKVSHAGDWMARLTSSEIEALGKLQAAIGDKRKWSVQVDKSLESIGELQAAIDNNKKWSVQVDRSYASDKKLAPSVTY